MGERRLVFGKLRSSARLASCRFRRKRGYLDRHMRFLNAFALPVYSHHALAVFHLPVHHKDPFDRMLIAEAVEENLTIVTRDPAFARYDVAVLG